MDIMNARDKMSDTSDQVMEFVLSCYDKDSGGFGPFPRHDPHLLYTLSAVQVAVIFDRLDMLDVDKIEEFICSLQQVDGSFVGDEWKEVDTRQALFLRQSPPPPVTYKEVGTGACTSELILRTSFSLFFCIFQCIFCIISGTTAPIGLEFSVKVRILTKSQSLKC